MPKQKISPVRLASGPRTVLTRPDVGAAGHIIQRSNLISNRIVVDQATLILVEEGVKQIRWSGGECVARAGEALSISAGEVVDIANTPGPSGIYRALWICWSSDMLIPSDSIRRLPAPAVSLHSSLGTAFQDSYRRAFDSLDDQGGLSANVAVHRLQEVLLWLGERGFAFAPRGTVSSSQNVRALLSADPAAQWSMEHVARTTATSVPTLRRRLAADGVVFRELLQDVRMSHALAMLQNTDAPILHIALGVGYASASRFAARFKARFGYLPTDVRDENRRLIINLPTRTSSC